MVSESNDPLTQDASPIGDLHDTVHQRVRLGILTIANESRKVEFRFLQENMGLTAGNLSQHIRILEEAGLITIQKGTEGRRPRTWVSITRVGKVALAQEIAVLKALVRRVEGTRRP
ncbi:MAG: transcriptional regulator [Acidimicrobiales bacterium]